MKGGSGRAACGELPSLVTLTPSPPGGRTGRSLMVVKDRHAYHLNLLGKVAVALSSVDLCGLDECWSATVRPLDRDGAIRFRDHRGEFPRIACLVENRP